MTCSRCHRRFPHDDCDVCRPEAPAPEPQEPDLDDSDKEPTPQPE